MKWIAKINEGDSSFGDEIYLAIVGGESGFEIVMSNEDDSDVMPGMTREEARENLEDCFGYYDTFVWLDEED
ncbi:MAG: hypothetical protein PUC06_10325 [Oscillospiraceae bacterium]|nr:hypothetical protein [Oscillospiraceae bacterium]